MSERTRAGTGPIRIEADSQLRRGMRRFKRRLHPLQSESMSPIDLPPTQGMNLKGESFRNLTIHLLRSGEGIDLSTRKLYP